MWVDPIADYIQHGLQAHALLDFRLAVADYRRAKEAAAPAKAAFKEAEALWEIVTMKGQRARTQRSRDHWAAEWERVVRDRREKRDAYQPLRREARAAQQRALALRERAEEAGCRQADIYRAQGPAPEEEG